MSLVPVRWRQLGDPTMPVLPPTGCRTHGIACPDVWRLCACGHPALVHHQAGDDAPCSCEGSGGACPCDRYQGTNKFGGAQRAAGQGR
jgi:hypothetical protein